MDPADASVGLSGREKAVKKGKQKKKRKVSPPLTLEENAAIDQQWEEIRERCSLSAMNVKSILKVHATPNLTHELLIHCHSFCLVVRHTFFRAVFVLFCSTILHVTQASLFQSHANQIF